MIASPFFPVATSPTRISVDVVNAVKLKVVIVARAAWSAAQVVDGSKAASRDFGWIVVGSGFPGRHTVARAISACPKAGAEVRPRGKVLHTMALRS